MSYRDIRAHLKKMYNADLSESLMSHITDSVLTELEQWRNRPLADQYAVVFFDGIRYKMRVGGQVVDVTVYLAIGVDMEGKMDVLGFYWSETESAKYWLQVFENFKARGVKDIFFLRSDNLSGIEPAIEAAFPDSLQQFCIVHQVRNSAKYLNYGDYRAFTTDLKKIYKPSTKPPRLSRSTNWKLNGAKNTRQRSPIGGEIGIVCEPFLTLALRFDGSFIRPTPSKDLIGNCEKSPSPKGLLPQKRT